MSCGSILDPCGLCGADSWVALVKVFSVFLLFNAAASSTARLCNGIFINWCRQRRNWEQPAEKNVTPTPPDDFVTFVHSRGLRGAPPRTIRGCIDWGTLFSAEHLVQSMMFGLTLTTSVSTAPRLLSKRSAVFIASNRLGKKSRLKWNSTFQLSDEAG